MKLTLFMTTSVDGFIARNDDTTPWSTAEWQAYAAFVKTKGNIIVGRKTYDLMSSSGEFQTIGLPFTVVLSKTRSGSTDGRTMFVPNPEEALAVVRGQGFTDILLGGGETVNTAFLHAGLIDELVVDIESQFLGQGRSIFTPGSVVPRLHLLRSETIDQTIVRTVYRVHRT